MSVIQDNLRFLKSRHPELVTLLEHSGGGTLMITQAKNGMPTARIADRWIHSAYDPLKEADTWAEQIIQQCQPREAVVVLGVGLLYHVEALCARLTPDTSVVVVIPDLAELFDALSVRSLGGWAEKIRWLYGSSEDVAGRMASDSHRFRLVRYEPAAKFHESYIAKLESALRDHIAHQQGGRLRIAVIGPIYGGSLPVARYVVRALETLGHRVRWIDHHVHHAGYKSLETLQNARLRMTMQSRFGDTLGVISLAHIAEDPPDFVLALSQAPLSLPVLEQFRKKKVLTAMWFVENFRHLTYWQQVAAGYDFWFVMQQEPCLGALKQAGARHVSYLPLAADPTIHKPLALTAQEQTEFGSDVSFLGAGYPNRRILLQGLLHQNWTFKLWGNEWEHPGPLGMALQRDGARIDTETSVKIFNATAVNINLHSYTEHGFDPNGDGVNPRTFELSASGAFQLVDHRTLLPELLDSSMVGILHRPEDLIPRVKHYLLEPEARAAMAEKARRHVLQHHTYVHRMQSLLAELGIHSPDRVGEVLRGDRSGSSLMAKGTDTPELIPLLSQFPRSERVELQDVAEKIRAKGPTAVLSRDELLILMMDEYRQETRDFV